MKSSDCRENNRLALQSYNIMSVKANKAIFHLKTEARQMPETHFKLHLPFRSNTLLLLLLPFLIVTIIVTMSLL